MVTMYKKYGGRKPSRMTPDSATGIYVTASVKAECA